MKRLTILVLLFAGILFNLAAQPRQKKALFVIVDGIPADVIEKVETPALDTIAKTGAYMRAYVGGEKDGYSQTPTISAVGYNSLLTGTWVNKHNVWDNDIAAPNYSYETIFRFFKNQYPDKKTAIFSTWLDNRTKLVGEGLPQTDAIKLDYHYDSLEYDTIRFPHDSESYIHMIDEEVVNAAASYIRKETPDLSWVYLEYTDDMGHRYGDSEKFYDAVKMMDDQIRRLWEAIQFRQRNFEEDWVIYITTDHGRGAETGKNHGGQSDRERSTWIVTSAKNVNPWFLKNPPGIVDIMPSIASWLDVKIPTEQLKELDGISLTGKVSVAGLNATYADKKLTITWKAIDKKAQAKIWLATTNEFKTGGRDNYQMVKQVPLSVGKTTVDVSKWPSGFYKIVLETPQGFMNRWVIVK
ncbi:MAG: type phosphodiesterase/nucleotide pyrophosphatase [Chitinophagaceae bacterium]|nr:type phosphodiesterase/nucleotide pyrophosphatase [Chitinophagaceae bacterium]